MAGRRRVVESDSDDELKMLVDSLYEMTKCHRDFDFT
jgi:hypothetical protein